MSAINSHHRQGSAFQRASNVADEVAANSSHYEAPSVCFPRSPARNRRDETGIALDDYLSDLTSRSIVSFGPFPRPFAPRRPVSADGRVALSS